MRVARAARSRARRKEWRRRNPAQGRRNATAAAGARDTAPVSGTSSRTCARRGASMAAALYSSTSPAPPETASAKSRSGIDVCSPPRPNRSRTSAPAPPSKTASETSVWQKCGSRTEGGDAPSRPRGVPSGRRRSDPKPVRRTSGARQPRDGRARRAPRYRGGARIETGKGAERGDRANTAARGRTSARPVEECGFRSRRKPIAR